jgi:hypothetical protein
MTQAKAPEFSLVSDLTDATSRAAINTLQTVKSAYGVMSAAQFGTWLDAQIVAVRGINSANRAPARAAAVPKKLGRPVGSGIRRRSAKRTAKLPAAA